MQDLEVLMDFINASDTSRVYVPDILWAVQEEYATFHCTTSGADCLFVMTYLQDKFIRLMDEERLKALFCVNCVDVFSKAEDHTLEDKGYIIYRGKTYRIDSVTEESSHQVSIMRPKNSDETWEEWLKDGRHWSMAKTFYLPESKLIRQFWMILQLYFPMINY